MKPAFNTSFAALAGLALAAVDNSPAIRADRLARQIESSCFRDVIAGRKPHVAYQAVTLAAKDSLPSDVILGHPIVAGLSALERLG